jgi:hypothetical protein
VKDSQFRVLYRVFLLRVVDLELLSGDGDPIRLLGQFAALLAAISFVFCAPLVLASARIDESDLRPIEHALIAITMLVVGLLSILNWDNIFPDKRDVLVLAPLPVHSRTIFMAKLSAMAYALGISVLALNVFTGLLWPLYFGSMVSVVGIIRSFAAYWTTIVAAAAFMFFSVLTVQGAVSQLLPRQLFLRMSAWIQMAGFCLFLGMYILEPSLEAPQSLRAPENQRLLAWLPSYWFFGLFHQLDGVSGTVRPVLTALAVRAWIALVVVVCGAGAALLFSYHRSLHKIAEQPDILPHSRRIQWIHWPRIFVDSLTGAVMFFSLRTLLRSRHHRVILSFYFGVGLAIVLVYIKTLFLLESASIGTVSALVSVPVVAASILMICVAVAGVRVVASLPIMLRANWIFRITELHESAAYLAAVRRTFIVSGVVPIWLGLCVLFFVLWPSRLAMAHLLVLGLLGMILVELCLYGFRKIPFTCSYLPGKGNLQYVFWACALFLLPLINTGARIEVRMLEHPLSYGAIIAVLGIALACAQWRTGTALRSVVRMQFDEVDLPEIFSLSLGRNE